MPEEKSKLREESLEIISSYFGEKTRKLYEDKFKGKSDALVLVLMRELLGEYLGQDETEIQMKHLYKLINKNENK